LFGVVVDKGIFEDGFSGSWFTEDDAKTTLLGMNFEDVKVTLLVFEEGLVFIYAKGTVANAEVGANHDV
jgi:hypothetical protein